MIFKEEVLDELKKIENFKADKSNTLTNNAYFLDDDILLKENKSGDARIPFTKDGLTLWVHQNGNISLNESNFFLISEALEGETNFLAFFLGLKKKDKYLPISLFEINQNLFEENVDRYTIFKNNYAIFIMKFSNLVYSLRLGLTDEKDFVYEVCIINLGSETRSLYSSMFFNFNLMHSSHDSVETKWFKETKYLDNVFNLSSIEDISPYEHIYNNYYLVRNGELNDCLIENTTSRGVYCQKKTGRFDSSNSLLQGSFPKEKYVTRFSDLAIAGDIIKFDLKPNESKTFSYVLSQNLTRAKVSNSDLFFEKTMQKSLDYYENKDFLHMKFSDSTKINSSLFTKFIKKVIYQVNYCANTKNSTLTMLGIRDIFQAIEAGLIWNRESAKNKILEALNFTNINGRLPRQYSLPVEGKKSCRIDSREFIDSGLWVVDTIYQYLAYTGDYEFLNKECGYIKIDGSTGFIIDQKDSVLKHLYLIVQYLIDNIDNETGCLKILYGDWNDAVDGLGKTLGKSGFTNGVSIMATFQLYGAINKLIDIVNHFDKNNLERLNYYKKIKEVLINGINKNAFVTNGEDSKILHGRGENRSFFVGSFNDVDGKSRDSLTSNAFYIISDFYKLNNSYVTSALKAYKTLDAKYGFNTFWPGFSKNAAKVGRIVNLPIGTAENGAVYIHGGYFAIDSLFTLGEDEFAWNAIFKTLPITHNFVSSTPFIMPNSYIENSEIDVDGESMNDWFTGTSSTLVKVFVRNLFGIKVSLDNVEIAPAHYFPFKEASISLKILSTNVKLVHKCENNLKRTLKINGQEINDLVNDYYKKDVYYLPIKELEKHKEVLIEVID